MKKNQRVVIASSGERGTVVSTEKVMGDEDGNFEETIVHIHLDDWPEGFDIGVGLLALVKEKDYPDWEPDPEVAGAMDVLVPDN